MTTTEHVSMNIDQDRVESFAKFLAALTAVALFFWKLVCPVIKWLKEWASTGTKVDALHKLITTELKPNGIPVADKIAAIHTSVQIIGARQQLAFENSPIPTYECNAEGQCIAVNPAWCELFGVTEHGMLGNGWLSVILDPDERERVLGNWQESVKNRYPHREKYRATNKRTGAILQCESATIECADKTGKTLLYVGTIKYITT